MSSLKINNLGNNLALKNYQEYYVLLLSLTEEIRATTLLRQRHHVFKSTNFCVQHTVIMHTTEIIVSVVDLWSLYHLWRFNSCCCYRFNELKLVPSSNSVLLVTCCPLHPLDTCCLQYSWYLLSSQFSWYWSSILSVKTCCLISPPDIFKFLSSPSFWYMFSSQFYWYWLSSPFS